MYSGGDGTIENPYLIATSADFFNIRYNLNAHYKQVADINMSDISWEPVGTFSGSYDGAGHKIYNLDLGSSMTLNYGLFGQIQPSSGRTWIKNITLVNPKVNQTISGAINRYFGFLAGQAINTDFINCNIYQGEIDFTSESETTEPFEDLGGICGKTSDCRFENCKVEIDLNVYESKDVGFICGYTYPDASEEDTVVAKCEVSGKFNGSFWYAGGIAGRAGGEVSKCSASMTIEGSGTQVGGLIGVSLGHVYECFSVATFHGKFGESSPLIGRTAGGIVENCYSHGQINLEADGLNIYWKAGGLTGGYSNRFSAADILIRYCYSTCDIMVSGTYVGYAFIGGLAGYNERTRVTIHGCFALNNNINTAKEETYIGRILSGQMYTGNTYYNNYANSLMTYNDGEFPSPAKTHDGKDGADITLDQAKSPEPYISVGWDFDDVWTIDPKYNDGLPYLKWFTPPEPPKPEPEPSKYIKIYDQELKLLAVVINAIEPLITEELNGAYTFDFQYAIDDIKSQYMQVRNIVEVEDNYFRIVCTEDTRSQDDTLTISVNCEHVIYDLIEQELDYFTVDGTATQMLQVLLQDTPFQIGNIESNEIKTVSIQEKQNKKDILYAIANVFGLEIKFEKFVIHMLKRRGSDNGVQFRYRRNIKGITRIVDARKKVNGQPSISYGIDAVMLEQIFGKLEHFELGDTVKVYDEGLGIDVKTRIVRISYNVEEKTDANVEIANFIPNITDTLNVIERTTIIKEKVYNGVRIGPDEGFVAERSDKLARNTMNATFGNKLELGDGTGHYEPVFYVTIENGEAKLVLRGNAEFSGKIMSSIIEASEIIGTMIEASEFRGGKITIQNQSGTERIVLSQEEGFRFQAWDAENEAWVDTIWMDDGIGKFIGEIISSTITGGLIRTAENGERIEISNNQIRSYNDSGELHGLSTNNSTNQFGDWEFFDNDTRVFVVYNKTLKQGVTLMADNGVSLNIGSAGDVLVLEGYINMNGTITINGNTISSFDSKTAGNTFGQTEKEMLQEVHDKLKELLDAINDN